MTEPIDWPHLLGDLEYLGLTGRELARAAQVGMDSVNRWSKGGSPSRGSSDRLQQLWCHMTGKPAIFLPRRPPGAMPMPVPGLNSNEVREPSYLHLEQMWNRSILGP
jgi:hypothetical protein